MISKTHNIILASATIAIAVVLFSVFVFAPTSYASSWQAGRIIDDSVFYDDHSLNVDQIQAFLNSKVPDCDTEGEKTVSSGQTRKEYSADRGVSTPFICLKDYRTNTVNKSSDGFCNGHSAGNKSAAQIIHEVAQSCGVSPKVLIVLLQKEQSLITDDWPWPVQYQKATGYGCPDTAPCNEEYFGLFNQLYNAARQFKVYRQYPHNYNHIPRAHNNVRFHPNSACGSSSVFIENQATAGLYNYTPYQPNQAKLNGSPDGCSSNGNYNFWNLYRKWFGQAAFMHPLLGYTPAAVSQASGKINVFARGEDNRLWQTWFEHGKWKGWNYIDGPSSRFGAPSSISFKNGHMDTFETRAGEIWHSWYAPVRGWRPWGSLGRPDSTGLKGSMSAVTQTSGKINVFARGYDGRLWQTWFERGKWKGWNYIDGPRGGVSEPTAVSWDEGHMDVFEIRDGSLWHSWYLNDGGNWRGWSSLGKPGSTKLKGTLAVTSQSRGKINIFARGEDGRLWQTWFERGRWRGWNYIDGQTFNASSPSATSWANGHMDVFEIKDGKLRHKWYFSGVGWSNWETLGTP